MKEIIFATTSQGKYTSAKRVMQRYDITVTQANIELLESQSSLEVIASHKVAYAYKLLHKPVLAMDAGFFIASLNGFPMMYVKPALQTIGIEGLLKLTEGKARDCEFKEVLCYLDGTMKEPKFFTRIVKGTLAEKPSGKMHAKHWSELALVFIPENERKTMAAMNDEEYAHFRHTVDDDSHFEQFGKYYAALA